MATRTKIRKEAGTGAATLGPQYAKDPPFTARMRLHQSWYRAEVLKSPCGTGPGPQHQNRYGNMLTSKDGRRGLNFLTPEIFRVAKERLAQRGGVIEEFRLLHNMLSSQPMCFNLFGPLVADRALATALLRQLLPGEVDRVTQVVIEFAPKPKSEYLDDNTAFDAFIEYRQPDGKLAFLGVETKLTEPFSQQKYDKPAYRRWMEGAGVPWHPDNAHLGADIEHNQLCRDHLLAIAMRDHASSRYAKGRLMLVRHPGDGSCDEVVRGYQRLLCDDDSTFVDMPLDLLVERFRAAELNQEQRRWLDAFELRYLDLERSTGGFARRCAMSFWEQYCAIWRYLWTHHKWHLLAALAFCAAVDIARAYCGLPYFSFLPWSIRP